MNVSSDQTRVSALILTLDEEANIGNCIDSLQWCDDIVVLDSYSQDRTVDIAREKGARVFQREFDNYARQRNYGLNDIEYKNSWLIMVDADEVTPPDLATEIGQAINNSSDNVCLFRMRRKDYFLGQWIRRSSGYPTWFGRLIKIGKVSVEREINEEYVTDGEVGLLEAHLHHYPFNKGFSWWVARHNRYSTMEAENKLASHEQPLPLLSLFSRDPTLRRKKIKQIVYSLPGRPLIIFLGLYIIRGGILEGRAGLTFCLLKAFYEFLISCKLQELERRQHGQNI